MSDPVPNSCRKSSHCAVLTPPGTAKVILVEAEPLTRLGLRTYLDSCGGFRVMGERACARDEGWLFERILPDVALIDVSQQGGAGLRLLSRVHKLRRSIACVAWLRPEENVIVGEALRAGALAVILRTDPLEEFRYAIAAAGRGERHFSPQAAACLGHAFVRTGEQPLSERQTQIYRLIGDGFGPAEIAIQLRISAKTVHTHIERMRLQLCCRDLHALRRVAIAQNRR